MMRIHQVQEEISVTPIDLVLKNLRDKRLQKKNLTSQKHMTMQLKALKLPLPSQSLEPMNVMSSQ